MCLRILLVWLVVASGCRHHRHEITSVPASPFNQCEPPGMPFYLPKPLLVVAKNVRHIEGAMPGLTEPAMIPNAFDDQGSYADIKANVTVPGGGETKAAVDTGQIAVGGFDNVPAAGIPEGWRGAMTPAGRVQDGLRPDSFYTYQIVFVPDLGQKYGLRIKGQPGEVRAAMNLVNGWMYTGMGPYYLKDSSTAQNIMAHGVNAMFVGRGVADALNSVTGLASLGGQGTGDRGRTTIEDDEFVDRVTRLANAIHSQTLVPREMLNYAEVSIYQPTLTSIGSMDWQLIAHHDFSRQYFSPDMTNESSALLQRVIGSLANPGAANIGGSQSSAGERDSGPESEGGRQPDDELPAAEEELPPVQGEPLPPARPAPSDSLPPALSSLDRGVHVSPSVQFIPPGTNGRPWRGTGDGNPLQHPLK